MSARVVKTIAKPPVLIVTRDTGVNPKPFLGCGLAVSYGVFTPLFTAAKTGIFQSGYL